MEALSKVKELFPNLADISPGEIAALFERFDERTRDDAGAFEDLPAGSSDAGWLGLPFTQVDGGRGGADGLFGLGRGCRLRGPVQQLTPPFSSNHV